MRKTPEQILRIKEYHEFLEYYVKSLLKAHALS